MLNLKNNVFQVKFKMKIMHACGKIHGRNEERRGTNYSNLVYLILSKVYQEFER